MIVFFSQILYDPFNEDLFHNADCTNERTLWENEILLKIKIEKKKKRKISPLYKVFQSVLKITSKNIIVLAWSMSKKGVGNITTLEKQSMLYIHNNSKDGKTFKRFLEEVPYAHQLRLNLFDYVKTIIL